MLLAYAIGTISKYDQQFLHERAPGSVKTRTGGDSPRPDRSRRPVDLVELQDRR